MTVQVLDRPTSWATEIFHRPFNPKTDLGRIIKDCLGYLPMELAAEVIEQVSRVVVLESSLSIRIFRRCSDCGEHPGPNNFGVYLHSCRCPGWARLIEDYGVVSRKVVTDVGVAFLVDAWQNLLELETMKFHGIGTGSTAEAVGNTALATELTTQYNPNSTRATGSLTEGATANIFKTIGTNTVDAGVTIEEHGLFSNATVASGVLWDRSLTGTKVLANGEGLESTYSATFTSGG